MQLQSQLFAMFMLLSVTISRLVERRQLIFPDKRETNPRLGLWHFSHFYGPFTAFLLPCQCCCTLWTFFVWSKLNKLTTDYLDVRNKDDDTPQDTAYIHNIVLETWIHELVDISYFVLTLCASNAWFLVLPIQVVWAKEAMLCQTPTGCWMMVVKSFGS